MRGQTTLDFATGASLFLLAVLFVFAFVPGILSPFTATAQEETVTANRAADVLTKDLLASPGESYLLDGECTAVLLGGLVDPGCDFRGSTLNARLGIAGEQSINITVRGSPGAGGDELLCWNTTTQTIVNASSSARCSVSTDIRLTRETDSLARSSGSVITARRIVAIDGHTATMEVRVW